VKESSCLQLFFKKKRTIKIFISGWKDKILTFDLLQNTSIKAIKAKIACLTGYAKKKIKISFNQIFF
jgi:hypothetical protein